MLGSLPMAGFLLDAGLLRPERSVHLALAGKARSAPPLCAWVVLVTLLAATPRCAPGQGCEPLTCNEQFSPLCSPVGCCNPLTGSCFIMPAQRCSGSGLRWNMPNTCGPNAQCTLGACCNRAQGTCSITDIS